MTAAGWIVLVLAVMAGAGVLAMCLVRVSRNEPKPDPYEDRS